MVSVTGVAAATVAVVVVATEGRRCVLDDEALAHFRELLLQRRTALQSLAETGKEAADTVELDQSKVGRLSRMDALQAQAMSQEGERRRGEALQRIEAALQRIDSGDYGYCLECDEPIATARLEYDPSVALCIHCASSREGL